MKKIILYLVTSLVSISLFGQVDITKRKVSLDSLNARGTVININDSTIVSEGVKLNKTLTLGSTTINSIDTTSTLVGNSDLRIPTQKAIKSYVDTRVVDASNYFGILGNYLYPKLNSYNLSVGSSNTIGSGGGIYKFKVTGTSWFDNTVTIYSGGLNSSSLTSSGLTKSASFAGNIGNTITKFDTSSTLSGNNNSYVPTQRAVKSYVDSKINYFTRTGENIYESDISNNLILGVSSLSNAPQLYVNGDTKLNGLLILNDTINEFSTDTSFSGNSNLAIPTEKAVKSYVDNNVSLAKPNLSLYPTNSILFERGDSIGGSANFTWNGSVLNVKDGSRNIFITSNSNPTASNSHNVVIGDSAGSSLNTATYNTIIGGSAGVKLDVGSYNTFVGHSAGNVSNGVTSSDNTFIGGYAGSKNTGGYNTFIGTASGALNTTATYNTFVGYSSGLKNTTGISNTYVGLGSGHENSTGNYNSVFGLDAGYHNTADYNSFFGSYAGHSNTTGYDNTANGYQSLYSNTTGYKNTANGYQSGYYNTTGHHNTFLGHSSGKSNVTGVSNTSIGANSLYLNTTGDYNVAIGVGSMYQNDSGYHNVAIGNGTLSSNIGGVSNTSVGNESGYANTSGSFNGFFGEKSGYSNTTGYSNTFIGTSAGYSNTTGYHNVFVGDSAGYANTISKNNVFIGLLAGYKNTEGEGNVFSGYTSGYNNITGIYNVFMGHSAGLNNTASYNTFIGRQAGYSNTSGSPNVAIGSAAGYSNQTGGGNIFIGYQSGYNETGSNKLYIENSSSTTPLIKGDFAGDSITINGGLVITGNDALRLEGAAPVWDDLFFPFSTGQNGAVGYPPFVPDSGYYTFTVDTTGVSKCIKYFTVQMPHKWDDGTTIFPHVHYKHETGVGTPKFRMKYKWFNIGDVVTPTVWKWYDMTTTTGTTDKTHQLAYGTNGISGVGKTLSSILIIQVYLSANPTNVNAYQYDIHYQIDRLGSRSETAK